MTQQVAIVTVKGHKDMAPARLADEIKSGTKASGLAVTVHREGRELHVSGEISREQLDTILSHSPVDYEVSYIKQPREQAGEQQSYPDDYGRLKGRVKDQRNEIEGLRQKLSQLQQEAEAQQRESGNRTRALETELRDLRAECEQVPTAQDFTLKIMLGENKLWESFKQFYDSTMQTYAECGEMTIEELERKVLDYAPLCERQEYQSRKEQFERAKQAREAIKQNPLLKLTEDASQLVSELGKLEREDEAGKNAREELTKQASERRMRIAIRVEDDKTFVILPFQYRENPAAYHRLEQPTITEIERALASAKVDYTAENFNGLLRYNITDMGTRLRNRLINQTIKEGECTFTQLGGEKRPIRVEEY